MPSPEAKVSMYDAWKMFLGVVGALAGVAVILLLLAILIRYALVRPSVAGGLTDDQRYELLSKARADDEKLLNTYGWVDKNKGIVRIPIEAAMQKVVDERRK